jgi:hypothetical protein
VKHCDNFLKISDSDISQRLIDEHLHLIDGFTNLPAFIIHYLENIGGASAVAQTDPHNP